MLIGHHSSRGHPNHRPEIGSASDYFICLCVCMCVSVHVSVHVHGHVFVCVFIRLNVKNIFTYLNKDSPDVSLVT